MNRNSGKTSNVIIMGIVLLFSIISLPIAVAQPTADSISVADASGENGQTIQVPVNITNVANGPLQVIMFDVNYTHSVVDIVAVTNGDLLPTNPITGADKWLASFGSDHESITLSTSDQAAALANGSTGTIAVLWVSVVGTTGQQTDMNLINIDLSSTCLEHGTIPPINGTFTIGTAAEPPTLVTYTITNTTITPPQTTSIDVRFSERVSAIIKIEDAGGNLVNELYSSSGVTNPDPQIWDGTYEPNGTTVPDGVYTVNVSGVSTTTGLSVVNTSKTITVGVTHTTVSIGSAEGSVGDIVNVSINITDASMIGAMDISVTYNPSILNGTGVANGSMIENLPAPLVACNLIPGAINISFVTYPDAIDGDGELFVVTFDVVGGDEGELFVLDIEADAYTTDVPPQYVYMDTADGLFVVNNSSTVSTVSFDPLDSRTYIGSTTTVNLTLDSIPDGLSGYNLTASLSDPSIAEILSVRFPAWATLHDNSTLPADAVWLKAADLMSSVGSGDTNISLGTLTIRGDAGGVCDIMVTVTDMDDDDGDPINPCTVSGTIDVTSVIALPDHDNPPTDPDSDGVYEDLNGNDRIDFDDVVQYFKYMEWIEENEPISCFDFNGNGRINFDDIVALFEEV